MAINKAIIVGNLGQDPELRYTQSGQAVTNFSVATSRKYKDASGEYKEETEWHRIVVWGKTAENCEKYLAKGRQVFIEGRIQTREWEDKEGNKKYTTEIVAHDVQFLQGGNSDGGSKSSNTGSTEATADYSDDDIPF